MTEVTKPNLDSDPRPIPPWDNGHGRAPWVEHSIKTVFENPWLRIEETAVDAPTGKPCQYGLVRFKNRAIGILPIFDDGTTIIVGQMRYPLGNYSWEIPEGGVPFDELPLDGAKRELAEEAGLQAAEWQEILRLDMSNSVTDETAICYLATGLSSAYAEPDETEVLEIKRIRFSQLLKSVLCGQIRDGITVATVLKAHHMAISGGISAPLAKALLNVDPDGKDI